MWTCSATWPAPAAYCPVFSIYGIRRSGSARHLRTTRMRAETMTEHPLTLNTPDGHTIAGRQYLPAQPVAILVISHGMAEHGDRYQELARWLGAHNILVITYHHRGHGPHCPAEHQGHYADQDGWQRVVDDLAQVVEAARKQHPGL